MTYTEKAIGIATENGYTGSPTGVKGCWIGVKTIFMKEYPNLALLDPVFWSYLGKGLKWTEVDDSGMRFRDMTSKEIQECYPNALVKRTDGTLYTKYNYEQIKQEEYLYNQHRFIDHLNANKSAESFFEKILLDN